MKSNRFGTEFRCARVRVSALTAVLILTAGSVFAAPVVRIKDIAYVRGVRSNQILGLGLVTGLTGKGDSSNSTMLKSSISTLVSNFGFEVSPQDIRSRNCAVVMVSAELPGFARAGDTIDATVSSIGDARDLDGGVLLQANLQAANGQVYAVAQGKVITTTDTAGVRTVGAIPQGAIVEREVISQYVSQNSVSLVLRNPDFVTAAAVQAAITAAFPTIKVTSPDPSIDPDPDTGGLDSQSGGFPGPGRSSDPDAGQLREGGHQFHDRSGGDGGEGADRQGRRFLQEYEGFGGGAKSLNVESARGVCGRGDHHGRRLCNGNEVRWIKSRCYHLGSFRPSKKPARSSAAW